ncbi:MAG: sugar phosphate isomerase/epimerase [Planctomycetes bacterium]|nr:sugar phosphate isomerase/epimerase [Planctomycetota bacterium]
MKLAIDSFSYHLHMGKHWFRPATPRDLRWYCDASRKLGADGLHIDPAHIDLTRDSKWLADYAAAHGLYMKLGASGTSPEQLAAPLATAERIGSPLLRTFIGGSCADGREATAARARAARDALARSAELAEKHGVVIAVEDHGDVFLEDMLVLLEVDSPFLGVCYDSGNFAAVGDDPVWALQAVVDRIVCTHLKDMCPGERFPDAKSFGLPGKEFHFCALGDGELPLERIVSILRSAHGDGMHITIEIHSAYRRSLSEEQLLAFEADNVARSVTYARDVLGIG